MRIGADKEQVVRRRLRKGIVSDIPMSQVNAVLVLKLEQMRFE
jgi:hypothetical protein